MKGYQHSIFFLLLLVIVFFPLWVGTGLLQWDAITLHLPWRFFVTESWKNGLLPAWNPFMNGGFPQMADPATWYPIGHLFALFSPYNGTSLNVEYLFHLWWAATGFYRLASSFQLSRFTSMLLASCFMLSGFFISNAQHLGWLIGLAWFVWCFWALRKWLKTCNWTYLIALCLFVFLMLSGGYPGITIVGGYVMLFQVIIHVINTRKAETIHWRKLSWQALVGLLVLASLSAVVVVPSMELSSVFRTEGLSLDANNWGLLSGALSFPSLLTMLSPLGASINQTDFWQADFALINSYFGLLPLMGLVAAFLLFKTQKSPVYLLLIAVFFMCLGLAEDLPFRLWLRHLPFWDVFRFSSLFRGFAILFFLLAAGFGLDFLFKKENTKSLKISVGTVFVFFLAFTLYAIKTVNFSVPFSWDSVWVRMAIHGGIQLVFLALFFVIMHTKRWKNALLILVLLDLGVATYWNARATVFQTWDVSAVNDGIAQLPKDFPVPSLHEPIKKFDEGFFYQSSMHLWGNLPTMHKTPSLVGNSPYYFDYQKEANQLGYVKKASIHPVAFFHAGDLKKSAVIDSAQVQPLSHQDFYFSEYTPQRWQVEAQLPTSGVVVLLQNDYFHWKVSVDGKSADKIRVNGTFMGVRVPTGKHTLLFEFAPPYLLPLAVFHWGAFASILGFLLFRRMKNRKSFSANSVQ